MSDRSDALRQHEIENARSVQLDDAAIKTGESAIKAALLANGGAVVAVLAFLGNLAGKEKVAAEHLVAAAGSLIWFAAGVALGLCCMLLAYLTNLAHSQTVGSRKHTWEHPYIEAGPETGYFEWKGWICHWGAILAGAASLAMFIGGICSVRGAIIGLAAALGT